VRPGRAFCSLLQQLEMAKVRYLSPKWLERTFFLFQVDRIFLHPSDQPRCLYSVLRRISFLKLVSTELGGSLSVIPLRRCGSLYLYPDNSRSPPPVLIEFSLPYGQSDDFLPRPLSPSRKLSDSAKFVVLSTARASFSPRRSPVFVRGAPLR